MIFQKEDMGSSAMVDLIPYLIVLWAFYGGMSIGHKGMSYAGKALGMTAYDLFLSPAQMRLVFDGDRALARVSGLDRQRPGDRQQGLGTGRNGAYR